MGRSAIEIYTGCVSCAIIWSMDEPLDQRMHLVMSKSHLRALDEWRRNQPDLPSRSEAIRRLIETGLSKTTTGAPSGGSGTGRSSKPGTKPVPRPRKPAPERKAEPAAPRSKLDQIRALREQGAR
jgi:hypothetical protein